MALIKPEATCVDIQDYPRTYTTKIPTNTFDHTSVDHPHRRSRDILTSSDIKNYVLIMKKINDARSISYMH